MQSQNLITPPSVWEDLLLSCVLYLTAFSQYKTQPKIKLLPSSPQSREQMVELPAWLGLPQTQLPLPAHLFPSAFCPFPLWKEIPCRTPELLLLEVFQEGTVLSFWEGALSAVGFTPMTAPVSSPCAFPFSPGYGQDLSGFGQGFSDPSQQPPPYGGPSVPPSSGPPAGGSGFGRGQNHNVQGFHPYRR